VTERDRAELPDLGPAFDDRLGWLHHRRLDEQATTDRITGRGTWASSTDG